MTLELSCAREEARTKLPTNGIAPTRAKRVDPVKHQLGLGAVESPRDHRVVEDLVRGLPSSNMTMTVPIVDDCRADVVVFPRRPDKSLEQRRYRSPISLRGLVRLPTYTGRIDVAEVLLKKLVLRIAGNINEVKLSGKAIAVGISFAKKIRQQ